MIKQPGNRKYTDDQGMYVLNLRYSLGATYFEIERATGIPLSTVEHISNGVGRWREVKQQYWDGRTDAEKHLEKYTVAQ